MNLFVFSFFQACWNLTWFWKTLFIISGTLKNLSKSQAQECHQLPDLESRSFLKWPHFWRSLLFKNEDQQDWTGPPQGPAFWRIQGFLGGENQRFVWTAHPDPPHLQQVGKCTKFVQVKLSGKPISSLDPDCSKHDRIIEEHSHHRIRPKNSWFLKISRLC